jgi:AcrR family transcriptional regulator
MATAATRRRKTERAAEKPARERVFAVAADLFYRKGIRAVGVEEIVNQAGVAKISLYRSFKSKDELVVAYLEQRNAEFWRQWNERFAPVENDPRALLDAIMDYLASRTTQAGYRGCPFINYAIEFPEASHPGHRVVEANKREWRRRFIEIAEALGAPKPKLLADSLLLLVEGTYAISQTLGGPKGPGVAIAAAAKAMVEGQMRNQALRTSTD